MRKKKTLENTRVDTHRPGRETSQQVSREAPWPRVPDCKGSAWPSHPRGPPLDSGGRSELSAPCSTPAGFQSRTPAAPKIAGVIRSSPPPPPAPQAPSPGVWGGHARWCSSGPVVPVSRHALWGRSLHSTSRTRMLWSPGGRPKRDLLSDWASSGPCSALCPRQGHWAPHWVPACPHHLPRDRQ